MKKIRALGYMEARMHYMHSCLRGTTQGCLALRINGKLDQERFRNAVNRAVSHLPLLQCVIQEDNNIPFFFKTEFENSSIVFDRNILDNQWLEVFNQENKIMP